MSLQWNAPLQPDYVITAYTLHHRVPSLKSQSEMWAPPLTATVQFHTYNPRGILFYQINSVMADFLGVKLHGGLPWLIFDVGSGAAVVGPTVPEPSMMVSGTLNLCDGQGHVVLFEQASNTFFVTVDTVHTAAITAMIAPLLTMKHVSYPLLNGTLVQVEVAASQFVRFETSLTDNGLNPFTEYLYSVTSLNSAGSADSSWSPGGRYMQADLEGATVAYSGANLQATVTGLSPATLYFFSLVAYNAGGSTQSNASSVTTIESSPDGVPFPNVTIIITCA
ncbi:hypothetical protein EMCRGX_G021285 [Ephydatia muelleri]